MPRNVGVPIPSFSAQRIAISKQRRHRTNVLSKKSIRQSILIAEDPNEGGNGNACSLMTPLIIAALAGFDFGLVVQSAVTKDAVLEEIIATVEKREA